MHQTPKVKFCDWPCDVVVTKYHNGRNAIELVDTYDGSRVAIATVNLPDIELGPDEVIIRNYSEAEGMLDVLLEADVIELTGRTVTSGFATLEVCKLVR